MAASKLATDPQVSLLLEFKAFFQPAVRRTFILDASQNSRRSWSHVKRLLCSDATRELAKTLLLSTLVTFAIVVELALFHRWLPRAKTTFLSWEIFDSGVAAVAMPLIAVACFYRLPMGQKRLGRRYVIRQIVCTRPSPEVNPLAIAAAIAREIALWRTFARSEKSASEGSGATLTLAHFSISVDWLLNLAKSLITGSRPVTIEVTFSDYSKPYRLIASIGDTGTPISADLDPERPFVESLERAIADLVLDLLETLDPVRRAQIHWGRENFDEALRLFREQPPSLERDLDLARMFLLSHRDDLAREQLDLLDDEHILLSWGRHADVKRMKAELLIKIGEYDQARQLLNEMIAQYEHGLLQRTRRRRVELLILLGQCDLQDGRPEEALISVHQAYGLALDEYRRIAGTAANASLEECLRRTLVRPRESDDQMLNCLNDIFESRAACLRLQGLNPISEYDAQLAVLITQWEVSQYMSWQLNMRAGQIQKYAATAEVNAGRLDWAVSRFQEACEFYVNARDGALHEARNSRASDGIGVRANAAWCEAGMFACKRALWVLTNDDFAQRFASLSPIEMRFHAIVKLSLRLDAPHRTDWLARWAGLHGLFIQGSSRYEQSFASIALSLSRTLADREEIKDLEEALLSPEQAASVSAMDTQEVRRLFIQASTAVDETEKDNLGSLAAFGIALSLLECTRHLPDTDTFNRWMNRFEMIFDEERSWRSCFDSFHALRDFPRHVAEHHYGLACLGAIQCNAVLSTELSPLQEALDELERAIAASRSVSTRSGLIGRARIDPDFDHLRAHPRMREALQTSATVTA